MSMGIVDTIMVGRLPNSAPWQSALPDWARVFTTALRFSARDFYLAWILSSHMHSVAKTVKTRATPW